MNEPLKFSKKVPSAVPGMEYVLSKQGWDHETTTVPIQRQQGIFAPFQLECVKGSYLTTALWV